MVLGFFKRKQKETIRDVIARKDYTRALLMIRRELEQSPRDRRVRLQLADVLLLAGESGEAVEVLESLADELAMGGFAAQSIAILRRIQALAPTHRAAEHKLNHLTHPRRGHPSHTYIGLPSAEHPALMDVSTRVGAPLRGRPRNGSAVAAETGPDMERPPSLLPVPDPPPPGKAELETGDSSSAWSEADEAIARAARAAAELFEQGPQVGTLLVPDPSLEEFDCGEIEISVEEDLDEFVSYGIGEAPYEALADAAVEPAPREVEAPLLLSLPEAERREFIASLPTTAYAAGEFLLTEGEAGDCLYLLLKGEARVFVLDPSGRNRQVRILTEGETLGEIAFLTRKNRTATVTAATVVLVAEIDRKTFDLLEARHPQVREALLALFDARVNDPQEAQIRGRKPRRIVPGRKRAEKPRKPRGKRAASVV